MWSIGTSLTTTSLAPNPPYHVDDRTCVRSSAVATARTCCFGCWDVAGTRKGFHDADVNSWSMGGRRRCPRYRSTVLRAQLRIRPVAVESKGGFATGRQIRLGWAVVRVATPAQPCKLEYSVLKYKNAFLPCRIYVNFLLPLNSRSVYAAFRHDIDSQHRGQPARRVSSFPYITSTIDLLDFYFF